MVFFFHHYELPVIMQQAQLQQLLIRSRQSAQQQRQRPAANVSPTTNTQTQTDQQATANAGPPPSSASAAMPNNDNNNNTRGNFLTITRTFINQRTQMPIAAINRRLFNSIGALRNILRNGVAYNIVNINNNQRLRMINLDNLRQINLGSIQISPTTTPMPSNASGGIGGGGSGTGNSNDALNSNGIENTNITDTRSTYQRNYEENNFLLTNGVGGGNSDDGINIELQSQGERLNDIQTNNLNDTVNVAANDLTLIDTPKTGLLSSDKLNELDFQIIENTPSSDDKIKVDNDDDDDDDVAMVNTSTATTPTDLLSAVTATTAETVATVTLPPPVDSNEKSNQMFLLEKIIETRDDGGNDNDKNNSSGSTTTSTTGNNIIRIPITIEHNRHDENLFTQSSSKEICSSNKGDTGNYNAESQENCKAATEEMGGRQNTEHFVSNCCTQQTATETPTKIDVEILSESPPPLPSLQLSQQQPPSYETDQAVATAAAIPDTC